MRSLSGGMKRRVLVGQALVHKPPVIVLDEPTAGVDVELRQSLWQFIRKLNRDGHTIILTTHYLEEAEALCGRIAMLKAGRVVALDSTQNLLSRVPGITCRLVAARAARGLAAARACARTRGVFHIGARVVRRARVACWPRCARRTSPSTSWHSRRPTSSRCSCRSWNRQRGMGDANRAGDAAPCADGRHERLRAVTGHGWVTLLLQGAAALLEGELPDDRRADPHGAAVSADLLARARGSRVGVRRPRDLHRVPGARAS